jgi:hypothetical protein
MAKEKPIEAREKKDEYWISVSSDLPYVLSDVGRGAGAWSDRTEAAGR